MPRPTQDALKTLERVNRRENLYICGPSGTGKSHFTEALGQAAVEAGLTMAWFTIENLGALIRRHRADDSIAKALARILRSDLVIIDDIGLLPVSPRPRRRLLPASRRRLRTPLASRQQHPPGFDEIMPKTLATATVDRLMHHARIVATQGDSYRLTQATTGKG
ncbi:ATP-binding protein [Phytoactinopolyspora mesophila]|uniref:ATP-binding protein n=1 Tax=Phytoactinopolyspora mesophila TaxID=2650750 RepID=A0A7K3M166_9ACTN|nr:ATP-binding protein [Phytoactinopolyspora mesophila]